MREYCVWMNGMELNWTKQNSWVNEEQKQKEKKLNRKHFINSTIWKCISVHLLRERSFNITSMNTCERLFFLIALSLFSALDFYRASFLCWIANIQPQFEKKNPIHNSHQTNEHSKTKNKLFKNYQIVSVLIRSTRFTYSFSLFLLILLYYAPLTVSMFRVYNPKKSAHSLDTILRIFRLFLFSFTCTRSHANQKCTCTSRAMRVKLQ